MPKEAFLPMLRRLVECYQAFERYSAVDLRAKRLTPSQFDILATLGNTPGMTFGELGARTLITKGTLTGVVDRLEAKGLVRRVRSLTDGRSTVVKLTARGEAEFGRVFPSHLAWLKEVFGRLSPAELTTLERRLGRLEKLLSAGAEPRAPSDLE